MIASEKHNTSLLGIFYSYFHNIEGPKLAVQYPRDCISSNIFNEITDYVITKDQLCGRLMRVCINDIEVVGYPMQISSHQYIRNSFNFNVCFVVKRGESENYESMVKKIVLKLEVLEREKGFLQQPTILKIMEDILESIYVSLKENNNCDVRLDSFTRLLLFPVVVPPKIKKQLVLPQDNYVPFLRYPCNEIIRLLPDTVMFQHILEAVNGVQCVYKLYKQLNINELQLKTCLAFLQEVGAISFIDIFDICNIYVLENYESLWDEKLMRELVEYSRIRVTVQRNSHTSLHLDSRVEHAEGHINLDDVRHILSLFHGNMSLAQITTNPTFAKMRNVIDIHRFVVFGCIHKILRRLYIYPVISSDYTAFLRLFGKSLAVNSPAGYSTVEEPIGMSMDALGPSGSTSGILNIASYSGLNSQASISKLEKRGEEEKSLDISQENSKLVYHYLYSTFQDSLFHISTEEGGMSRHSSCLSFQKDYIQSATCDCQVQQSAIVKLLKRHQCLEYMSLHLNCCIPSIMRVLESMDKVVFLKR